MNLFGKSRKQKEWEALIDGLSSGDPFLEDRQVAFDAPEVPDDIRIAVNAIAGPGYSLWRIVTKTGIEWWLLDQDGELIEAYWLE